MARHKYGGSTAGWGGEAHTMSNDAYECPTCGSEFTFTGEPETCYGSREYGRHSKTIVVRPCGMCGDPITQAEICRECADGLDTDATTPIWGDG